LGQGRVGPRFQGGLPKGLGDRAGERIRERKNHWVHPEVAEESRKTKRCSSPVLASDSLK